MQLFYSINGFKNIFGSYLVVGIPSEYNASEHRYSLIDDLNTAFPSANLEKGVIPDPFN